MILQALKGYYDRKAADPESGIAPYGWEWKEFPFLVICSEDGDFITFQDTREGTGRSSRGHMYLVPTLGEKKGNGIKSNLFWENIEYLFGIPVATKNKPVPDRERVRAQHAAFQERIENLSQGNKKIRAALKFARKDQTSKVKQDSLWGQVLSLNKSLLLSICADGPITDDSGVRQIINNAERVSNNEGTCLVSGGHDEIAKLEAPIKGIYGSDQKNERALVSFNLNAFCSFKKEKNFNSPICRPVAFAYTTALNHLLLNRHINVPIRQHKQSLDFRSTLQPCSASFAASGDVTKPCFLAQF
jgi:CRISPR-associated protein Csd1